MYFGTAIINNDRAKKRFAFAHDLSETGYKTFIRMEPLQDNVSETLKEYTWMTESSNWIIIGAGKVKPERIWIEHIVRECKKYGVPVFLRNNLAPIWGEPLVQETPWNSRKQ